MSPMKTALATASVVAAPLPFGGTEPYFNPLTQSTAVGSANHLNELSSPWQAPAGMSQVNLMSLKEVEAEVDQSVQRVASSSSSSMFDHTSVGSTIDKTFGFPCKVDGARGWGCVDLKGMPDVPNRGEQAGEIANYLERVGGGGEFRSNPEMFRPLVQPRRLTRPRPGGGGPRTSTRSSRHPWNGP